MGKGVVVWREVQGKWGAEMGGRKSRGLRRTDSDALRVVGICQLKIKKNDMLRLPGTCRRATVSAIRMSCMS